MIEAARQSKTLQRNPEAFREIVEQQLQGSALQSLFLPVSALTELKQSGELAPLLARVEGLAERYQEAEAAGGELHLSTADYLVAFGQQHEALKDNVRVLNQSTHDSIQFEGDYAQNLHDLQEVLAPSEAAPLEQTRQRLIGELLQAGFNRTEATHYASLHTAFLQQLEERTGLALADLQQRFDLAIKRQMPEKVKAISDLSLALNRLRKGDMPSQQAIFGDSLRQALVKNGGLLDEGGELANRDTDVGKVGNNRLARNTGKTLDEAAQWAFEAGYLGEATPNALLAALDKELAGQPVYSAQNHNETLHRIADDLSALQQVIDDSGLELEALTDEEILQALTGTTEQAVDSAELQELQQQALDNLTVAELDNLPALADKKAIEAAFKAFGVVENKNDGRRVGFPASTAGKIKGHRGFDARQIAAAFDRLFETAVPMFSEMEQPKPGHKDHTSNIEAYHHYLSAFRQNGETYYVRFTVQQMRAGRKAKKGTEGESLLHSAFISAVSIYNKSAVSASPASLWDSTQSLQGSLGSAALSDTKLAQWLGAAKSELQQGGKKSPRGSIRFEAGIEAGQPRKFEIRLEATRDLSTLLHELGHFYLEVVSDVVASGHANAELSADLNTIRQWLGAEEGAALTVEQHEQFARGFEAYLAEGRAPSDALVAAFARFKRWLIGVYKQLTRLNVTLNDEIRGVFNRLLASEQQVLEAENQSAALALFESAEQAGMSEADFVAYKDSLERAHAEASEQVQRDIVREESTERQKWWKGEADKIRAEVAEEVDAQPVYDALKRLRSGEFKLNTDELIRRYGAVNIKKLAFLHQKDGRPAEVLAPLLGFDSADALVKALLAATPRRELIEQETAQRMLERFGTALNSEAAEKALNAVHGAAREKVLTLELIALGKQTAHKAGTSAAALKQAANTLMQQRQVKSITPETFRRSEAKAGREAFNAVLKGDLEAAYLAKQRQLLNFHLWREATAAKKSMDASIKRLQAFRKDSRRAQLGKSSAETLALIDTLLYQFGLASRVPDEQAFVLDWYQRQLEAGTEPYLPSFLLNVRERQSVRELTFAQLTELDEFAQHLWHLAKQDNELIAAGQRLNFWQARQQLIEGGYQNRKAGKKPPIDPTQLSPWDKLKNTAGGFVATMLKMEQIISWLDGDKVDGAWSQRFWQPFVEAQNEQSRLQKELTEKPVARLERYQKEGGRGRLREAVFVDSIGQSLSYNALLSIALNSGNLSNKTKLLRGYGWDESQLAGALAHLNQADWQLVQDLWDLVGSLWPAIEQLQRDLTGLPPDAVQATPVETPFGSFKGGYWPLVYDKSSAAYARVQESNPSELFESGYIRATTPKGHTKSRNEGFAAPILLSIDVVVPHLAQVIHDLTHRKAVRDGAKIASDPQIKQMLIDTLDSATADQFMLWIKGLANRQTLANTQDIHVWARLSERLRSNLAIAYMGFSATTSITQLLGYTQSHEYFAKQGGRRYLYQGVLQFLRHPFESAAMIKELSGEMRYRSDHLDRDMNAALRKVQGKTGVLPVVQRLAFKPIAFIQSLVDYPTWLGAFNQAQSQGLSHDLSVQAADRAVRLTQMAAGAKDLATVQRDHGLMRWLTIVYSYQSLLFNRLADLSQSELSGTKNKLLWLERFSFLVAAAAILAPLLQGRGPDDDEDFKAWAALKIATYPLSSVPVLRDAEGMISSGWAMRGTTPISDVGNALYRFFGTDDEHKRLNAAIEATGYSLGLPVAQPKRTAGYLWERLEGEHEDDDFKDFMRGVLFGPPKE